MTTVVVIGSGMAGLGASHRLRQEAVPHVVVDRNTHVGGHTFSHVGGDGFVFDEGPHISFTKDERIRALLAEQVDGDVESIRARVNNYWQGRWIKHPAQCNLHGLPTDLVVRVLTDLIEAKGSHHASPANYSEWLIAGFGRTFAETFPMQYGRKYHTVDARLMSTDWLGPRLYQPKLDEVIRGALSAETNEVHYIQDFRYPSRGGFLSFLKRFADDSPVRLGHRVERLDPHTRTLFFAGGAAMRYDHLISSMPLPELIRAMPSAPEAVRDAAAHLACTTCVVVNVGVDRRDLSDWHWTYFYDDDFCFSRISFPHMFSPRNAPEGMGSIQAEIYFSAKYKPLTSEPAAWIPTAVRDLRRCGLIRDADRVVHTSVIPVPYANVIFDLDRAAALEVVRVYLSDVGISTCGRYGEWGYHWTDESFMSGEQAAQRVLDAMTSRAVPLGS